MLEKFEKQKQGGNLGQRMGIPRLFRISDGLLLRLCVACACTRYNHTGPSRFKSKSLRKVSVLLTYGISVSEFLTRAPPIMIDRRHHRNPTMIRTPPHHLFARVDRSLAAPGCGKGGRGACFASRVQSLYVYVACCCHHGSVQL